MPRARRHLYALLAALIEVIAAIGGCRELEPSPTPAFNTLTPAITPIPTQRGGESVINDYATLRPMPARDDIALAISFGLVTQTVQVTPGAVQVSPIIGMERVFWVADLDKAQPYTITARLRAITPRVEMWVDERAEVNQQNLERSALTLEQAIIPTNLTYFDSELQLGTGSVQRIVVLNAYFSGASGYYSLVNELPVWVNPHSNERRMFNVNLNSIQPGTNGYDATLAHELQHMLHWHADRDEDAWVTEGSSELAEDLNGYNHPADYAQVFTRDPDLQLNTWSSDVSTSAHYAASYLFLRYYYQRFGAEALRLLVAEPQDGLAGITSALLQQGVSLDSFFADWLLANDLNDPAFEEGRYAYQGIEVNVARTPINRYPVFTETTVHQYAADYYELATQQTRNVAITFSGQPTVTLLPVNPTSGQFYWWSNRGDEGHSWLERDLDLSQVATATLHFSLWYEIESGWDYAYARVSTDDGRTWEILRGRYTTDYNPIGNALGAGYTGHSGTDPKNPGQARWVEEAFDLAPYCGRKVLLRFDYVTDEAVNENGLVIDDFTVAEIGLSDDVEHSNPVWRSEGFLRTTNVMPQGYIVQLITFGANTNITRLPVNVDGQGSWVIENLGSEVKQAVLVIAAVAPVTTQLAHYHLDIR